MLYIFVPAVSGTYVWFQHFYRTLRYRTALGKAADVRISFFAAFAMA